MGGCAPGQAIKKEALGPQEDAVQFGWIVDFILQLRAAETLQVLLGENKGGGDRKKGDCWNPKWPSGPSGSLLSPELQDAWAEQRSPPQILTKLEFKCDQQSHSFPFPADSLWLVFPFRTCFTLRYNYRRA